MKQYCRKIRQNAAKMKSQTTITLYIVRRQKYSVCVLKELNVRYLFNK